MRINRVVLGLLAVSCLAQAGVISATNNTTGLFDESSGSRTVTFTGAEPGFGSGTISKVTITINFAKADGEDFDPPFPGGTPYFNEIVFTLTAPSTTGVNLIAADDFNSGSIAFDGTITFDQTAANVVNVNPDLVQAGTFRPTGNLNDFNGQNALGIWTLFIEDTTGADALRFRSFQLNITTDGQAAVPEPSAFVLVGAGLLAAGLFRRRLS